PSDPPWPSVTLSEPTTPFSERAPLRKLVVMIDHEVAQAASDDLDDELGLLLGLLTHPYITLLRYADDGPAEGVEREPTFVGESVPGWVVVGQCDLENVRYP